MPGPLVRWLNADGIWPKPILPVMREMQDAGDGTRGSRTDQNFRRQSTKAPEGKWKWTPTCLLKFSGGKAMTIMTQSVVWYPYNVTKVTSLTFLLSMASAYWSVHTLLNIEHQQSLHLSPAKTSEHRLETHGPIHDAACRDHSTSPRVSPGSISGGTFCACELIMPIAG